MHKHNVVADEFLKHITTSYQYDRIWIVKLNQNYWDWLSRAVHLIISMVWGRPQWQHTAIIYKPANQNRVWWMEVLFDGVHEYETDLCHPDLQLMLHKMLFSYYEILWMFDKELEGISERLTNVYESTFETGAKRYWRYVFSSDEAEYSGQVVCTTFVSYVLSGRFDEVVKKPCKVYFKADGSPLLSCLLVTSVDLSNWRNPNATY